MYFSWPRRFTAASPKSVTARKKGRNFGSADTLAQADATLEGAEVHGPTLAKHGFGPTKVERLRMARDGLVELGVSRESAKGEKKQTSKEYVEAMNEGKALRHSVRSIVESAGQELVLSPEKEHQEGAKACATTVSLTSSCGADADSLASQLDLLRATLERPEVQAVAAEDRPEGEGDETDKLDKVTARLRVVSQASETPRGTPEETERLDILDGLIVDLVRGARKAARAAARTLGQPSIIKPFELTALYSRPAKRKEDAETAETKEGEPAAESR